MEKAYNIIVMTRRFERYKGIPVELIIKKDLRKNGLTQRKLAQLLDMSYNLLNSSLNGHRLFKKDEAYRIESLFNYEKNFIIKLQEIRKTAEASCTKNTSLTVPTIRACVFWDVEMNKLDWQRHRRFIVERISIYGSQEEKDKVNDYYQTLANSENE